MKEQLEFKVVPITVTKEFSFVCPKCKEKKMIELSTPILLDDLINAKEFDCECQENIPLSDYNVIVNLVSKEEL